MANVWTIVKSSSFWNERKWKSISSFPDIESKKERYKRDLRTRQERNQSELETFINSNWNVVINENCSREHFSKEAKDLEFWMIHQSWSYCKSCKKLISNILMPNYLKKPLLKSLRVCDCLNKRYVVPKYENVPVELRNLSNREVIALRPLNIHTGNYDRLVNGYRKKGGMFRISWCEISVVEKIEALPEESKTKCQRAYQYLISSTNSSYKSFIDKRNLEFVIQKKRFNFYEEKCGLNLFLFYHM